MDSSVLIVLIGASGSTLVAITALLLNYRGFAAIDSRFNSLESAINTRFASVDRRLDGLQSNMKDFNKTMTALVIDVAILKDKAGI